MDSKPVSKKRWDNFVNDGDFLVLKNVADATADELLTVHVNLTTSGLPHDCIPVGDLKISREAKLKDLKDKICSMDYFAGNNVLEECIRVRQKSSTNVTMNKMEQRIQESKIRNGLSDFIDES